MNIPQGGMDALFNFNKSSLRAKALLYFFSNPTASLYVREMAQIFHVDATNLSKEFSRLEKAGVFVSNLRGNQKYYAINKTYPLYNELRSIVFKTVGVEGGIKKLLDGIKGIVCAFIYGSFAEGKERPESDIDLFIVGKPEEDELIEKIGVFEKDSGREINYNIYLPTEFKQRKDKQDSFITNVLKRKKIMLKGDISDI
jgi:predicted nucleotidyltransferase